MGATSAGQVMKAVARMRSDFGVTRSTTSRPTGTIMAPPMPCSTRAAKKLQNPFDRPQRAEARVNRPMAEPNTVRAPKRSAAQPLSGMPAASMTI